MIHRVMSDLSFMFDYIVLFPPVLSLRHSSHLFRLELSFWKTTFLARLECWIDVELRPLCESLSFGTLHTFLGLS